MAGIVLRKELSRDLTPEEGDGLFEPWYRARPTVTINAGVLTVPSYGCFKVETQGAAATDDLDRIVGLKDGEPVMLTLSHAARVVVVKHGTFLKLADGLDFELLTIYDSIVLKSWDGNITVECLGGRLRVPA